MSTTTTLTTLVVSDPPKSIRETLCLAQSAIAAHTADLDRRNAHLALLGRLIDECDRHRPIGPDAKHGNRHTPTCGCEDVPSGGNPTSSEVQAAIAAAEEALPQLAGWLDQTWMVAALRAVLRSRDLWVRADERRRAAVEAAEAAQAVQVYRDALSRGLSDYEARETAYPSTPDPAVPGETQAQAITDHQYRTVAGHPDDDECAHRGDGTDLTYYVRCCGLAAAGTEGDQAVKDRARQAVAAALRWTATFHGSSALQVLAEQVADGNPVTRDLMAYVERALSATSPTEADAPPAGSES